MTKQRFLMPSQTIYHEIKLYMFEYILACTQFPIFISTHAFDQGHQGFFFLVKSSRSNSLLFNYSLQIFWGFFFLRRQLRQRV